MVGWKIMATALSTIQSFPETSSTAMAEGASSTSIALISVAGTTGGHHGQPYEVSLSVAGEKFSERSPNEQWDHREWGT